MDSARKVQILGEKKEKNVFIYNRKWITKYNLKKKGLQKMILMVEIYTSV